MSDVRESVFSTDVHGKRSASIATDLISGVFGGCAGIISGHPLVIIKLIRGHRQSSFAGTRKPVQGRLGLFENDYRQGESHWSV